MFRLLNGRTSNIQHPTSNIEHRTLNEKIAQFAGVPGRGSHDYPPPRVSTVSEHTSKSVGETESIAAELARTLTGGDVIALYGDLGAGKTQFTRGLVLGLGGDGHDVSSPTFVLLNVYDTSRLKVFHLDAYRVTGPDDFDAIGFSELLEQEGVVVVEWPARVEDLLPRGRGTGGKRINVWLEAVSAHGRRIRIERLA